jgi:hypothetical protein
MKPKKETTKGSKLGGKPNGKTCTCPLCGNVHQHGNAQAGKGPGKKKNKGPVLKKKKPESPKGDNQNDLSTEKV